MTNSAEARGAVRTLGIESAKRGPPVRAAAPAALIGRAVANEARRELLFDPGPEIMSEVLRTKQERLREKFEEPRRTSERPVHR